jgi:hypothetical protein
MANQRTITACLVAFTPLNGFVDILVHDNNNSGGSIVIPNRYFTNTDDIRKVKVTIHREDDVQTRTDFMVLYDHRLHGTKERTYLVMQAGAGDRLESVERRHYMGIVEAVNQ